MKPFVRPLLSLVLLAGGLELPGLVRAGPGALLPRVLPRGDQTFRLMLHGAHLKPLENIEDLKDVPQRKILIIFGDLGVLTNMDLEGFLQKGGAILVASDRKPETGLLWDLGAEPTGAYVMAQKPKQDGYLQQAYCPYLTNFPPGNHPLFQGVHRLATNTPSELVCNLTKLSDGERKRILQAQFDAQKVWVGEKSMGMQSMANPVFGLARDGLPGKLLILAGHGVFLNNTMFHPENVVFTRNCLAWLAQDDLAPRDQVLFIEEGRIITTFDVPLLTLPRPPLPTAAQVNNLVRGLEEENFFNRLLFAVFGRGAEPGQEPALARERIVRVVVILLSLLVALYGLRGLWKARHRIDGKAPLVSRGTALQASPGPLVEQRRQDVLGQGNFWEAARELARLCFAEYALRSPVQPPPRPEVAVDGGWWRRRGLDRLVRELWQLAYGAPFRAVSAGQLVRLKAEVERVNFARAAGTLVFREPLRLAPGPTPAAS